LSNLHDRQLELITVPCVLAPPALAIHATLARSPARPLARSPHQVIVQTVLASVALALGVIWSATPLKASTWAAEMRGR